MRKRAWWSIVRTPASGGDELKAKLAAAGTPMVSNPRPVPYRWVGREKTYQIRVGDRDTALRRAKTVVQALMMYLGDRTLAEANISRPKVRDDEATIEFRGDWVSAVPMEGQEQTYQIRIGNRGASLRRAPSAEQALLMYLGGRMLAEANVGRVSTEENGVASIEFRGDTVSAVPMDNRTDEQGGVKEPFRATWLYFHAMNGDGSVRLVVRRNGPVIEILRQDGSWIDGSRLLTRFWDPGFLEEVSLAAAKGAARDKGISWT